ncbi:hypothetical protein NVP1105O_08 [Vibrio phage 1.105.O._10N.286.49.B4]|nr:hypothetical protein NVP1105O_08 [Vibrio phage 1.105.O._10N.286.49.B4]
MKMSDKFRLPVFYECDPLSEVAKFSAWHGDGEICKSLFLAFDDCDADLICKAINNHDRMMEEIAELKGAIETINTACIFTYGHGVGKILSDEDGKSLCKLLDKLNQEGEE